MNTVLVFSSDGTYVAKSTLSIASTAADVAGKTVVVTSPQEAHVRAMATAKAICIV